MMFANQSPIANSIGYNGGMGYPVPPTPIANVGGYGYNQPANYGYNPYMQQTTYTGYNPYMNQQQQPVGGSGFEQYLQQPIAGGAFAQYNPQQSYGYGYQSQPMVGGYYTNNYYGANPYLIQRQMELQRMQEEEAMKQQASIMKMISRNVNSYLGVEVDDEYLSQYDPYYVDQKEIQCEQHWQRMQRLEQLSQQQDNVSTQISRMNQNNNTRMAQMKENYPDDMSLFEFLERAGELYCEAKAARGYQQEREVNRVYNQGNFQHLLNLHNTSGSYYSSIMNFDPNDISTDDLEVTLPENLARSYSERKAKFFSAILGG